MSTIKFVYFDLGNVLLNFSHQRMVDQVAAVAGVSKDLAQQHMFDNNLENRQEMRSGRFPRRLWRYFLA